MRRCDLLTAYKHKTNIGVGIGLVLQIAGRVLMGTEAAAAGIVLVLASLPVFIWGCCMYAKGKGRDPVLGFLGLLSILGLLILVGLEDRHRAQ